MRKCKCWQVKIFPQKSWFSQKLHSTILKILQCFTKPDRPSSESPAALPAGARDARHDLSAIRLLKRSQLSSLCSIAFFQCPLCLSQCHWRHLGDQTELHLAVLGEIQCVTTSYVCQTGGMTVGCARQIFINSQALLEDVGDLSEYSLSSDLRFFFWSCEEQQLLPLCTSVQVLFFFISYLCHARETF